MTTDSERTARIILAAVSEPGDEITGTLVTQVGAEETLRLATDQRRKLPGIEPDKGKLWQRRLSARLTDSHADDLDAQTKELGLRVLIPGRAGWPVALDDLGDATPLALWVKGDPELLTASLGSRVTLTGARAATGYGTQVASDLAQTLAAEPRILVSGGAYGIDAEVHRAALAVSRGKTIAVLAGGLARYYPAGNRELFDRIAGHGLLASEVPPSAPPTRWRFLARSRLLAALSGATVVVEAGARSGALHTAAHADELGREVGAVPGPITSAASVGCHRLLQEGIASVVATAQDISRMLDPRPKGWALGQKYQDLARAIEHEPPSRALNM